MHAPVVPLDTHVKSKVFAQLFLETSSHHHGEASTLQLPPPPRVSDTASNIPANTDPAIPCVHGLRTRKKLKLLGCVPRKALIEVEEVGENTLLNISLMSDFCPGPQVK